MKLLYIGRCQFLKKDDRIYALPAYGKAFWEKYLDVFDEIHILGEQIKGYLNNGTVSLIEDPRIHVDLLPANTNPKDFCNDSLVKKQLRKYICQADAILIKPSCRKGMMAIHIAKKLKKPYMVELTGDLNLTLKNSTNLIKRMYRFYIHSRILSAIKDCEFGLYVTQEYLQKVYPIKGKQCGCTDTCISKCDTLVLENRLQRINGMQPDDVVSIGLVASYHDNRKGIDTAIEALSILNNDRIQLHILGLGTEEDRMKWKEYAQKLGVEKQLFFDPSLSGVENVLKWNDNIDIAILPSRSEGLPRCVVESLSRACPCIISNVCGMPELVEEKWLHSPDDSKTLANLIEKMLADKEHMRNAAKVNFEKAQEYDVELLTERRNEFLLEFRKYCENCR